MIPWVHVDTAKVPGGGELKLMQRGSEFSILASAVTLMNSRMSGSEIALAELVCDRLRGRTHCHMLIGGYGMGYAAVRTVQTCSQCRDCGRRTRAKGHRVGTRPNGRTN